MSDYEQLKQAIQQANPEIIGDWSGCNVCGTMCGVCDDRFFQEKISRPIRLADVLLVTAKIGFDSTEEWYKLLGQTVNRWNCKDDNLDHQPGETKQFLIELLVTK